MSGATWCFDTAGACCNAVCWMQQCQNSVTPPAGLCVLLHSGGAVAAERFDIPLRENGQERSASLGK